VDGFILVLLVLFVFMYFLLIRPQRNQQKRHQQLLANLKVGDEVITAGGIYGDVSGIEEDRVQLLIAEDVEIEVARRSIASVVPPETYADEDEAADEVDAEAAGDGDTGPVDTELEKLGRAKGAQPRRQD
jgi:preprotein translocase subunit YajC